MKPLPNWSTAQQKGEKVPNQRRMGIRSLCVSSVLLTRSVLASTVERAPLPTDSQTSSAEISLFTWCLAWIGTVWWAVIALITTYGFVEICLKFNSAKVVPAGIQIKGGEVVDRDDLEGVTILRPIKGVDPELELCLESCLLQKYPRTKTQVLFCVEDAADPAVPIINKLIQKHQGTKDVQLLIDQDYIHNHFGPNPKINNLSKGFTQAKFNTVWVLDSNVWVSPGTLARSISALHNSTDNGRPTTNRPVMLVHHVPLALSTNNDNTPANLGARLDEMFLHTSHAKFYVFFNKASFAPCVNGKSNLYRISDLDTAVKKVSQGEIDIINNKPNIAVEARTYTKPKEGIRFFARYIGEDNMIGIALWALGGRTGMTGDVVCQPIGGVNKSNSIRDYVDRRVRWLRVRKYMVLAATLIEPTTESLVIGLFGSYGVSTLWFGGKYMWLLWLLHECVWCWTDYTQCSMLMKYTGKDELGTGDETPFFLHQMEEKLQWWRWFPIWCLREALALPTWIIAMCGTQVDWRNRPFKIRADLSAEEL